MKQYPKLSAIALALALGSAATYSWAQGYSDTYSDPPGATIGTEAQDQPMTEAAPPSMMEDSGLQSQEQSSRGGPQGPIRDDMSDSSLPGLTQGMNSDPFRSPTSAREAPRYGQSYSAGDRGFEGFLQFQERGTNSP